MQFQVPQFIEVEDKIFGPLTFKQFVYMTGGAGSAYVISRILPLWLASPFILAILAFAGCLAFLQFNGRPFIAALEHGFYFLIHPKLYLWSNAAKPITPRTEVRPAGVLPGAGLYVPKLSDSKLHELAWSLDIRERIAGGITENQRDALAPITTARDALVR